jgi:prepilin-type N-terminal cleavage/methylation domain-containing protein
MNIRFFKKRQNHSGFSLVEIIIVIAIVSLIFVIIALGASEAQKTKRDNERKAYARTVFEALEEFNKNNGKFPGCTWGCDTSDMERFMDIYLPEGTDPSTGLQYHSTPITVATDAAYGDGATIKTSNEAAVYIDNNVHHDLIPREGQMYIATAHWCYQTRPDLGDGPPLAGDVDKDVSKFVIVIYQERGGFYCLDNYAG